MSKRLLKIMTWVVLTLITGCAENEQLDELIEQSPFRNQSQSTPPERMFVTCNYYPLELPGLVDISAMPFWDKYNATGPGAPGVGLSLEMIKIWNRNGLKLAVAPLSAWPEFRDHLIEAGGVALPQTMTFIRNHTEVADLPTYVVEQPASVFVSGSNGSLRGYTLAESENGECVFRVNAIPGRGNAVKDVLNLKIVPEFHSFLNRDRFIRDDDNELHRIRESPAVVFDQLTLSGTLPNDYFICIGPSTKDVIAGNLAQLFMTRKEGADNYQMMVVLVPSMQSTAQIKADFQKVKP